MKKKFKIIIVVEGDAALAHDLTKGHIREGMETDVFGGGETILSFDFEEVV